MEKLETDYLIVGAGAMGMAFADELLTRDRSVRLVMIDRHAKPGGHWNDAYGHVTLHQPAAFYGVNSEPLGPGGTYLASGIEVLAYYEKVLTKWEKTGRLQFFPRCEYTGENHFRSLMNQGREYSVEVKRKTVDSTYMNVTVPSTRPPRYEVAEGVRVMPPNDLSRLSDTPADYVVVGAGKTGMDAVLFLLKEGCDPEQIRWIIPHDAWLIDRATFDPSRFNRFGSQLKEVAGADSLEGIMRALDAEGKLLRLDPEVWPTKYRCATVSQSELSQLRRVKGVIRKGRVLRIEADSITLEEGSIPTSPQTVHVDCTADGLARRPVRPVFDGRQITLQSVFVCQQVFSASFIAYAEFRLQDDEAKNALCRPIPHPESIPDYLVTATRTSENLAGGLRAFPLWFLRSRLSIVNYFGLGVILRVALRDRNLQSEANAKAKELLPSEFPD